MLFFRSNYRARIEVEKTSQDRKLDSIGFYVQRA